MKVKVDMCKYYYWDNYQPRCKFGYRANLSCHLERKDCPKYECSWHYPPDEEIYRDEV